MERGSNKRGLPGDDRVSTESEELERSGREARARQDRLQEDDDELGSGHRISGSGSSADSYTYTDHGDQGGAGHPRPAAEDEERT